MNTLAVYAVHRYLKWLGIETDLSQSDSWHPVLRNRLNVADLVVSDIGKLECCPVLPGETTISLSPEVTEDRIGYIAVQFDERLDQVQLLGFTKAAVAGVFQISRLRSLDELIDELSLQPVNLREWFEGIFDKFWQGVETLLTPRKLAFKDRGFKDKDKIKEKEGQVERAKIDLGLLINCQQVTLVVSIWPEENQEIGMFIQVHPMEDQEYLPQGLKLKVILESDSEEVEAREADNWIQLALTEFPGKPVTVQVTFEDRAVTEKFVI